MAVSFEARIKEVRSFRTEADDITGRVHFDILGDEVTKNEVTSDLNKMNRPQTAVIVTVMTVEEFGEFKAKQPKK